MTTTTTAENNLAQTGAAASQNPGLVKAGGRKKPSRGQGGDAKPPVARTGKAGTPGSQPGHAAPTRQRRKPVRRVFGRVLKAVEVVPEVRDKETGELVKPAVLANHWFELRQDGLHVRRFRRGRKTERTWTFQKLANVAKVQMELFI